MQSYIVKHLIIIACIQGRNGKGSVYVFASGNGGLHHDNCAADGYIGNIHALAISSATMEGKAPVYAERCAGVVATAYSGGLNNAVKIVSDNNVIQGDSLCTQD